jgi:hypothetical protein
LQRRQGEVEGITRHLPKICVVPGEATEPGVLQLLRAPHLGEGLPLLSEPVLGGSCCTVDIKQRAVCIEHAGLDAVKLLYHHHRELSFSALNSAE